MKQRKWIKRLITIFIILFILINVIAIFQAYKFTHFDDSNVVKTQRSKNISTLEKLKALVFGVNNPRPVNKHLPAQTFETITLQSNKEIECWHIPAKPSKGTTIIFHGYSGEKFSMLDKPNEFVQQSYSTLLVDFMGSGGSEGDQTTIGYKEAAEVKTAYDYIAQTGEKDIYLFGTSMGAVAILKEIHDYHIQPKGIIIECPFGSLYQTTCARFHILHIPVFPMAAMLVF